MSYAYSGPGLAGGGITGTFSARSKNMFFFVTPWKINMEPTIHPFRKENDLPNLHDYVPC